MSRTLTPLRGGPRFNYTTTPTKIINDTFTSRNTSDDMLDEIKKLSYLINNLPATINNNKIAQIKELQQLIERSLKDNEQLILGVNKQQADMINKLKGKLKKQCQLEKEIQMLRNQLKNQPFNPQLMDENKKLKEQIEQLQLNQLKIPDVLLNLEKVIKEIQLEKADLQNQIEQQQLEINRLKIQKVLSVSNNNETWEEKYKQQEQQVQSQIFTKENNYVQVIQAFESQLKQQRISFLNQIKQFQQLVQQRDKQIEELRHSNILVHKQLNQQQVFIFIIQIQFQQNQFESQVTQKIQDYKQINYNSCQSPQDKKYIAKQQEIEDLQKKLNYYQLIHVEPTLSFK